MGVMELTWVVGCRDANAIGKAEVLSVDSLVSLVVCRDGVLDMWWCWTDLTRWAMVWPEDRAGRAATTAAMMNFMVGDGLNGSSRYKRSRYREARDLVPVRIRRT